MQVLSDRFSIMTVTQDYFAVLTPNKQIMDGMALRKGKIVEAAGVLLSGGAGEKE